MNKITFLDKGYYRTCRSLLSRKYYYNGMNWVYNPIAKSEDGQIKVIKGRVQEEEIKILCDRSKYVRGEKSSWRRRFEVIKIVLSS